MPYRKIFLIVAAMFPSLIFAQWKAQNTGTNSPLSGLFFIDDKKGWITFEDSCLITDDGGTNWLGVAVDNNNVPLFDVEFINDTIGIATSSNGTIYRSFNGGFNWQAINTGITGVDYFGIAYIMDNGAHVWIAGTDRTIVYSSNLGSNWILQSSNTLTLNDIYFVNGHIGWAVGDDIGAGGTILYTSDGGQGGSWEEQLSNVSANLNGVWFHNEQLGWAVGDNGVILKTDNGGGDWYQLSSGVTSTLTGVSFADSLNGVAVGKDGIILHTKNGGINWLPESGSRSGDYRDVHYESFENCWIIGDDGTLLFSRGAVSFIDPSGGQEFEQGSRQDISWTSSYLLDVRIDLSTNNGVSWDHEIITNTFAPAGYLEWLVQNEPSTECKLRIQALSNAHVLAESKPFEIYERTLDLTAPAADETLASGGSYMIKWQQSHIDSIDIMFRENPLWPPVTIARVPASSSQFWWFVPEMDRDQCRILIYEINGDTKDSTGIFSIAFDNENPTITLDPLTIRPKKGDDLDIVSTITDENATTNTLFFRQGGDTGFRDSTALISIGNDQYQGTIPSTSGQYAIDERGLEFYIKSVDHSPRANTATTNIIYRPVTLDSTNYTILSSQPGDNEIYQMIAMPYDLNDTKIGSVLEDDLGQYDPYKWRLWYWRNEEDGYGEFTQDNIGEFTRGKSFWLATIHSRFVSDAGQSYNTQDFVFSPQPGWSQIGHPFAFPVSYADISDANPDISGASQFFDYFDKSWMAVNDALEPGRGYFVKNMNQSTMDLTIPPIAADDSKSVQLNYENNIDWKLNLRVRIKETADNYNFIGMSRTASSAWDNLDQPEPPPSVGKFISLYFPHNSWQPYPDIYTSDFRPEFADVQVWDFTVETNVDAAMAEIYFMGIETVSPEFEIHVLDATLNISQNVRENPAFRFPIATVPYKKQLKLIVGKSAYLEQNNLGINEIPDNYELFQNFPNPVNKTTVIRYGLPTAGKATLKVYNIQGKQVAVLLDNVQKEAGYHVQVWNGLDKYGYEVPSGLYFYQIKIGEVSDSRKMLIIN